MSTIKIKESEAFKEVKEIRQELYEQTKNLSAKAFCDRMHQEAEDVIRKYDIKIKRVNTPGKQ